MPDHTASHQPVPDHTVPDDPAPDAPTEVAEVDRDARVLRRATIAGATVFLGLAVVLAGANVAFGGTGLSALVWVTSAAVVGALVTAGWLVLVVLLDMVAGVVPSRRRAIWTAVAFVVAFVSPVLPAAALRVAAGG